MNSLRLGGLLVCSMHLTIFTRWLWCWVYPRTVIIWSCILPPRPRYIQRRIFWIFSPLPLLVMMIFRYFWSIFSVTLQVNGSRNTEVADLCRDWRKTNVLFNVLWVATPSLTHSFDDAWRICMTIKLCNKWSRFVGINEPVRVNGNGISY